MESLQLLWSDIKASADGITFVDLSQFGFMGLWVIILLMPLKGVDQRDPLACLVYTVFIVACAATLMFALPALLAKDESSFKDQFLTLMIVAALAVIRWSIRYGDLREFGQRVFDLSETAPKDKKA